MTHAPIERTSAGHLHFPIYDQTGRFVRLTYSDTPDNRRFVEWLRVHDRANSDAASLTTPMEEVK